MAASTATNNVFNLGGGTSVGNAATIITFYTAADAITTTGTERMRINSAGDVGIGPVTPLGQLHVDQPSTSGEQPVLVLVQADVDEDYLKIIGTSDANADRALVDAVDFPNIGAIAGYLKINVRDDQGTNPIVDGDFYLPFYQIPTA